MALTNEQKTEVINRIDSDIEKAVETTMGYLQGLVTEIRKQKAESGLKNKDIITVALVPENYIYYRILMKEDARNIVERGAKVTIVEVKSFSEDEVDEILEHLAIEFGIGESNE